MFDFIFEQFFSQELYDCELEIDKDSMITKHSLSLDEMHVVSQFSSLLKEANDMNIPIRIKISRMVMSDSVWGNENIPVEHYVEFRNKEYISKYGGYE